MSWLPPKPVLFGGWKEAQSAATAQGLAGALPMGFLADECAFKPGQSGNPSGKPGTDLAALYARRFFEAHPEGISEKLKKNLKGLDASAYSKLADRVR